jgi:ferredoxin-NADP reductase
VKNYIVTSVDRKPHYLILTLRPRKKRDTLAFEPGQYATIGLLVNGRPTPMRCFSMVSSPNNPLELQFAMRVEGHFTQAVNALRPGDTVRLQGPHGTFVIEPNYDKNIMMLAAGIGITPFISMVRRATEEKSATPMTLLYTCHSQNDIPFYHELLALQKRNPHFQVIFFVSDGAVTPQANVTIVPGHIQEQHLQKLTQGSYSAFSYFICGPEGFRTRFENLLQSKHVVAEQIVSESFTQTSKASALFGFSIPTLTYVAAGIGFIVLAGFIMTIDLSRHIPRAAANETTSTPAASSSTPATTTPATNNSTTSTTPVQTTPTPAASSTPATTQYQAPTSSVS